jgi:ABC-type xylose transport system permease subunit
MEKKEMTLAERLVAPTSSFFKKIRTIGLCLAAVGGAIIAAPISLPAIVVTVAGYLAVAGGVMTAVAQATVEGE